MNSRPVRKPPCPCCGSLLTEDQVKRLWAQLNQSKAAMPTEDARKARAKKAAAARWAKHTPKNA